MLCVRFDQSQQQRHQHETSRISNRTITRHITDIIVESLSLTLIMFTFSSCIVGYIVCSKSIIKILNSCNEYCAKYVQSLQQKTTRTTLTFFPNVTF